MSSVDSEQVLEKSRDFIGNASASFDALQALMAEASSECTKQKESTDEMDILAEMEAIQLKKSKKKTKQK